MGAKRLLIDGSFVTAKEEPHDMITSVEEYQKAQDELHQLEERLLRLQQTSPLGAKRIYQSRYP